MKTVFNLIFFLTVFLSYLVNGQGIRSIKSITDTTVVCDLAYLTTIENFDVYKHNPSGAILYRAKFAVDADGCPRAYGPNNSGLDWTANAGYPGNWWGIVTDAYGEPIIQGPTDPYPGMYVSSTSLVQSGYPDTSPYRYVDSENIPYIALPSALQSLGNIAKGDLAYVRNSTNGNGSFAYFADTGPVGKLGEGSMYLAVQLGLNSSPKTGGTSLGIIDYIVFPQSGYGQGTHLTVAQIDSVGQIHLNAAGGFGLPDCLTPPTPTLDCGSTVPITCGVTYHGESSTAQSIIGTYGCNSWTETGPERLHSIIPAANGTITATVSNYTGDLDVYLLGSCNADDCLGSVGSTSATYNSAIAGHTYYMVVDADDGSGSAYDIIVTCPTPESTDDFSLSGEGISSVQINAGAPVTVDVNQNYSGTQLVSQLPTIVLGYYLSTDCNLSPEDTLLGVSYSEIGSDAPTSAETAELFIPASTNVGNYYLLFVADDAGSILESNENNNAACIAITIGSLVLDCYNAVPLTCGTNYHGASSTVPSHVGTFGCNTWTETGPERVHTISPNLNGTITATISNFTGDLDVYILGSCDPWDCLGVVSSSSATLSEAVAGQTYYIVVDADDGSGSAYDIIVNCPEIVNTEDISTSGETVDPTIIEAGENTNVSVNQNYTGIQPVTDVTPFFLDYYLSSDCNLDSMDLLLGSSQSEIGSDNPVASESSILTVPVNISPGIYYILFVSDSHNDLDEVDETNNIACIQVTITQLTGTIKILEKDGIRLFPNPTSGLVWINPGNRTIEKVLIINESGAVMDILQRTDNGFDMSNYSTGIYFLKIIERNKKETVFRIFKEGCKK